MCGLTEWKQPGTTERHECEAQGSDERNDLESHKVDIFPDNLCESTNWKIEGGSAAGPGTSYWTISAASAEEPLWSSAAADTWPGRQ